MPNQRLALAVALLTLLAAATTSKPAAAVTSPRIEVLQAGVLRGTIAPYSGPLSAIANYNYTSPSGFPIYGPAPAAFEGRMFFYAGADGLYFNVIFNTETIGNGTVDWTIQVLGSTVDPAVKFSDDPAPPAEATELMETTNNLFAGKWDYMARVDGGVIGPLGGTAWTITIDQLGYASRNGRGIEVLRAFDATGASLQLFAEADRSQQIVFRAIPVPEPGAYVAIAPVAVTILVRRRATPASATMARFSTTVTT